MLYILLAIYGGIGLLCTIVLIAATIRKGQTDHLGRSEKSPPNITIVTSPLHRNSSRANRRQQADDTEATTAQPVTTPPEAAHHRTFKAEDADEDIDLIDASAQDYQTKTKP